MKKTKLLMGFLATLCALPMMAQRIECRYSVENNYWMPQSSIKFADKARDGYKVVSLEKPAQEIEGIGGTFSELGWDALCYLDDKSREEVIYNFFDRKEANFTMNRFPIGASDFALNFYSLNDVADDFDMINFSVARDRHILMRFIKAAMKYNPDMKFWACPWCPPAWMKTNNHYASNVDDDAVNHNGLPKEKELELPTTGMKMQYGYLKAYALYFSKFVKAYAKEGIKVSYVGLQNEPCSTQKYASCTWRPEDMAYFVGKFLGPQFEADKIDAGILFATINRDNPAYSRVALDDAGAKKYWVGAGYQWDGKGAIPYINKEYPNLKIFHTEAECGNGSNDWAAAEHTWWQVCHYLRHGARNFQYWNLVLDETGMSPWGWHQNSLVTVDTKRGTVRYNPEYYLMKHLAHYVTPGAHYLSLQNDADDLVAFVNPDGKKVVLAVNRDNAVKRMSINVDGKYINIEMKAKSFYTLYF